MFLKMLFSITIAILVTLLGHYYLYSRIIFPIFGKSPFWIITFTCLWSMTFFGFIILRIVPHFLRKIFEIVMFIWMGVAFLFMLVCLLTSPINMFLNANNYNTAYLSYFVLFTGTILTIYSMYLALKKPIVIEKEIKIKNDLPKIINDLKFVVLSDIHVSGLIGRKKMKYLAEVVNQLKPDIIFITGDLMDGSVNQLKKEIAPLETLYAKYGIYYITGNHEYYSGPLNWKKHFAEKFHWKVISNSSHSLKISDLVINILGIEDRHWLSYEKIPRKLDKRLHQAVHHLEQKGAQKEHSLNVLLAHQPKDSRLLVQFPFIDIQISGHTHGGQIWPLQYIVKKDQKYVKGLYQINENQQIYVNQGTGFWGPPMRLGTNCEISLLTFKQEKERS
jgi:predicted MPP superfamily phosphohydrolase